MYKTGNETTDKLIGVEFTGNIVHSQWYKTITKKKGKADIIAINILADIVYWYRPSEIRNESTGQTIGFKKRYKADLLQRGYESYAEQFGLSKRQVKDAMDRLEELNVIRKEFRNITTADRLFLSNVMYIDLNFEILYNLSFLYPTENSDTSYENSLDVVQNIKKTIPHYEKTLEVVRKNVGGGTLNVDTYTKTTTQITPKIKKNKAVENISTVADNFTDESLTVFRYFISKYMKFKGEVHPTINNKVVDKLNNIMEEETIYDYELDKELIVDTEAMCTMIDKYFTTSYALTDGGYADHRIYHFLSDMVLKNLYYQSGCY